MNSKLSKIKTEYYLSIKVENISDKNLGRIIFTYKAM